MRRERRRLGYISRHKIGSRNAQCSLSEPCALDATPTPLRAVHIRQNGGPFCSGFADPTREIYKNSK